MSDGSCPQKCALDSGSGAVLPLLKLRIVCEPKGLPFTVSSMTTSFEMPGQARGLNYLGECRAGAFTAHP